MSGSESLFKVDTQSKKIVNIKVIGVGGGGCNMVNQIARDSIKDIELVVANTDAQSLNTSLAKDRIQLGEKLTRGLGAGMKPEIGMKAAEESFEQVKEALNGADLVFVATGLGGGTGTGASAVVARAAKECGALTIGVCTLPFMFEGSKRARFANEGLEDLKRECDSMVVIKNDKLLAIVGKSAGIAECFSMVDSVLSKAVKGISSIVLPNGTDGINTDFADLSTVMSHKGIALMGMGSAEGDNAAYNALKDAIESPLLDNVSISGAMGVLVHFQISPNYSMVAIGDGMQIIEENIKDDDADIISGISYDPSMNDDEVRVTIIATGFEQNVANNQIVVEEQTPRVAVQQQSVNRVLRVSGGYDMSENEDLDTPTFIRRQQD